MFVIAPLNWDEWMAVLALSSPVIAIDEVLKFISVNLLCVLSVLLLTRSPTTGPIHCA